MELIFLSHNTLHRVTNTYLKELKHLLQTWRILATESLEAKNVQAETIISVDWINQLLISVTYYKLCIKVPITPKFFFAKINLCTCLNSIAPLFLFFQPKLDFYSYEI